MMENSQLKLLFEISLLIRANNPFAMAISLNMNNIKKCHSWNMKPIEDEVYIMAVFICSILECSVDIRLEYKQVRLL